MPLFEHYQELLKTDKILHDPSQEKVLENLNLLLTQLIEANNKHQKRSLFNFFVRDHVEKLHGIYIYGSVGSGKSMLMDMFFQKMPFENKLRIHFHEFMRQIHEQIAKERAQDDVNKFALLKKIALTYAKKYKVICFDELQINDIVDAMIVGKLFFYLLEQDIIFVITSNRHPNDLYKDGLQRERFIPFIRLIELNFDIETLVSPNDYRRNNIASVKQNYFVKNHDDPKAIRHIFSELTNFAKFEKQIINYKGRELTFKKTYDDIIWISFDELCGEAFSAADYIEMFKRFNVIFLIDVPIMTKEDRNEAKRFTNLIDVLYENNITSFFLCDAEPDKLYLKGDGSFEFERTASRLMEMQSDTYLKKSKGNANLAC